jgi:SprT-like family
MRGGPLSARDRGHLNAPNREAWLTALVQELRPLVAGIGQLPRFRISCSLPSSRAFSARRRRVGECWSPTASADGTTEILVSPADADPFEVASTVLHEMIHAIIGVRHGHGPAFRRAMTKAGLTGHPTATRANDETESYIRNKILPELGPYPHAALNVQARNGKKQSTRLLKVVCPVEGKYNVRIVRQWVVSPGPPHCACHNLPMIVEAQSSRPRHVPKGDERAASDVVNQTSVAGRFSTMHCRSLQRERKNA